MKGAMKEDDSPCVLGAFCVIGLGADSVWSACCSWLSEACMFGNEGGDLSHPGLGAVLQIVAISSFDSSKAAFVLLRLKAGDNRFLAQQHNIFLHSYEQTRLLLSKVDCAELSPGLAPPQRHFTQEVEEPKYAKVILCLF